MVLGAYVAGGLAQGAEIAGELIHIERSALTGIRFASTLRRLEARPGLVQDVPAASKQGLEGDPSDSTSAILVTLDFDLQQSVYGMARTVIGVSRQC